MEIEIDSRATVPTIKKSPFEKLEISGMKEGIHYIFNGYKNKELKKWTEKDIFKNGDKISLEYYFQPYGKGSCAFEHLNIIAYRSYVENNERRINNLVLYFDGVESAKTFIVGIDFKIDTLWALNKIRDMNREINELKSEYKLN